MLNLHWNGDLFNQRFVISPRTEELHACLSPKWQNLTTLASEEKWFLFRNQLQFRSDYMGYWITGWITSPYLGYRQSCQNVSLISTYARLQRYLNWLSTTTLRFSFHNTVITRTSLFKYTENFTTKKMKVFWWKILNFFTFLLKTEIVGTR